MDVVRAETLGEESVALMSIITTMTMRMGTQPRE